MSLELDLKQTRLRIAELVARRERLKRDLDVGALRPRTGLVQLDALDQALSDLDSRFKALWDAAHPRHADRRDACAHQTTEA